MCTRGESDILQERDYLEEPSAHGRIILKQFYEIRSAKLNCLGIGFSVAGSCECDSEASGSINGVELLSQLS
jgi:hypothetical protein